MQRVLIRHIEAACQNKRYAPDEPKKLSISNRYQVSTHTRNIKKKRSTLKFGCYHKTMTTESCIGLYANIGVPAKRRIKTNGNQ